MDRIVNKIAGLGVPGIMLMVAISMTGLSGAAITAALALLGPGGMLGGIAFLLLAGAVTSALTEFGFDALFKAVIKKLYKNGETKETIRRKIEKGPWSKKLKAKAISDLEKL
ncbi:hypothetical protein [Prevotella sp.]|uniref:hypothetical protein n=1 Tax=Prevotella sp. TaxID=59823 RepID=UPI0025D041D6|nr:hypothetical protein [Prevotella sp.]